MHQNTNIILRHQTALQGAYGTLIALPVQEQSGVALATEQEDLMLDYLKRYAFAGKQLFAAGTALPNGNGSVGYDDSLKALLGVTTNPELLAFRRYVNLWGVPPFQDPFWLGNLTEIRSLLVQLGLNVNSIFTLEDSVKSVGNIGMAQHNIIVSNVYGINAGIFAEEVYRANFISTPLPIGPTATEAFIRVIGKTLKIKSPLVDLVINRENERYLRVIQPYLNHAVFARQQPVIVVGDANYSVALTRFLADDLGWNPLLTICTDRLTPEERERITISLSRLRSGHVARLHFASDDAHIHDLVRQNVKSYRPIHGNELPVVIVGTVLEKHLAIELGAGHLSVTGPASDRMAISRGYSGYNGGIRLIEDLAGVLHF